MSRIYLASIDRKRKVGWTGNYLFTNWVRELDRKFVAQGRQIALISDNCPAHPDITGLEMIKLNILAT